MKTPAIIISGFRTNPQLLLVALNLEEQGLIPDVQDKENKTIAISVEALQIQEGYVTAEDVLEAVAKCVEDTCCAYELDCTPDMVIDEFDFENDIE